MTLIPGATHLFEEAGTLEQVAELAAQWFVKQFPGNKADRIDSGRITKISRIPII